MENSNTALITNDAVVFGLLMIILMLVFYTSTLQTPFWKKFYTFIPAILLCYFIPSVLNSTGIISGENSNLYFVASRYLLPASLVLLTISVDLKEILKLGKKAIIMFLTGTAGVILGGPIAILLTSMVAPEIVGGSGPEEVWRGMSTVAGSWIGGSANQATMFELFEPSGDLFSMMIAVDVILANIWMAFLLYGAIRAESIDKFLKADASAIEQVKLRVEVYRKSIAKIPTLSESMVVLGVGFGAMGIAHLMADSIAPFIQEKAPCLARFSLTKSFFWLVVIATAIGLGLSFTRFKKLEGVGASRLGTVMIYVLVATIGTHMNIMAVFDNPGLFVVGALWMMVHIILLLTVAKLIKAPFFFVAVGSQANIGGAASAPVVASAFHPSLAPVGVLLAVFGYVIGTYGAFVCAIMMQAVSP